MELDENFFTSVNMEVVRKKYYNANRVNALLDDIRRRAEETNRENRRLKAQLEEINGKKSEIGDLFLEAQSMSREITGKAGEKADRLVQDAQTKAEGIIRQAHMKADEILREARAEAESVVSRAEAKAKEKMEQESLLAQQQEYSVRCMEECFEKLRRAQLDAVDMLNEQWQSFLCGLYVPEKADAIPAAVQSDAPAAEPEAVNAEELEERLFAMADIEEKINAILLEMNAIESDDL